MEGVDGAVEVILRVSFDEFVVGIVVVVVEDAAAVDGRFRFATGLITMLPILVETAGVFARIVAGEMTVVGLEMTNFSGFVVLIVDEMFSFELESDL